MLVLFPFLCYLDSNLPIAPDICNPESVSLKLLRIILFDNSKFE